AVSVKYACNSAHQNAACRREPDYTRLSAMDQSVRFHILKHREFGHEVAVEIHREAISNLILSDSSIAKKRLDNCASNRIVCGSNIAAKDGHLTLFKRSA